MSRRALPAIALALSLLFAAPFAAHACTAPSAQASAKVRNLVRYSREGGLVGSAVSTSVSTAGRVHSHSNLPCASPRSFTLSKKRLGRLRARLAAVSFSKLAASYGPPPGTTIADGITETVRYHHHTVRVSTGATGVPAPLQSLLRFLESL